MADEGADASERLHGWSEAAPERPKPGKKTAPSRWTWGRQGDGATGGRFGNAPTAKRTGSGGASEAQGQEAYPGLPPAGGRLLGNRHLPGDPEAAPAARYGTGSAAERTGAGAALLKAGAGSWALTARRKRGCVSRKGGGAGGEDEERRGRRGRIWREGGEGGRQKWLQGGLRVRHHSAGSARTPARPEELEKGGTGTGAPPPPA
jgi:hypothetical protein